MLTLLFSGSRFSFIFYRLFKGARSARARLPCIQAVWSCACQAGTCSVDAVVSSADVSLDRTLRRPRTTSRLALNTSPRSCKCAFCEVRASFERCPVAVVPGNRRHSSQRKSSRSRRTRTSGSCSRNFNSCARQPPMQLLLRDLRFAWPLWLYFQANNKLALTLPILGLEGTGPDAHTTGLDIFSR